jgi:hypothetical protein
MTNRSRETEGRSEPGTDPCVFWERMKDPSSLSGRLVCEDESFHLSHQQEGDGPISDSCGSRPGTMSPTSAALPRSKRSGSRA